MLKVPKIYIETTMFNHYFDTDRETHEATVKLFKEMKEGKHEPFTSAYVVQELVRAGEPKRTKMLALISEHDIGVLETDEQAEKLMEIYVEQGMIPKTYKYDGLHIAIASINNLDYIVSANFQHINKVKTKTMTESINKQQGYKGIIICSPMEVVENG